MCVCSSMMSMRRNALYVTAHSMCFRWMAILCRDAQPKRDGDCAAMGWVPEAVASSWLCVSADKTFITARKYTNCPKKLDKKLFGAVRVYAVSK